jgi:1,4-dihydroxy-2-naphthoate octaprenyltransferase
MAKSIREFFSLWFRAYRAPFLTASITPVVLGTAVAWYETRQFDLLIGLLALVGTIFGHLGANIFNDYYDHITGDDDNNPDFTPFSGGSRMIQNGILTLRQVAWGGTIAFSITVVLGVILIIYTGRPELMIFGLLGIGLGYVYTALPIKLAYRGLGELAIFLTFGPVTVTGAYFVQTGQISKLVILSSVPVGLLVALILYVNELQDENADRRARKNTLVVNIANPVRSLKLYRLVMYIIAVWITGFAIAGYFPYWTLLVLLLAPKYIQVIQLSKKPFDHIREMIPLSAGTIGFQFVAMLLWAATFIIAGFMS